MAPGVLVATSAVYSTTSTVLVGDRDACLLVDPALTAAELAGLRAAVESRGLRPVARWVTHAHWDHLLAAADWPDVPAYAAVDGLGWLARVRDEAHDDEALAAWLAEQRDDGYPEFLTRPPAPFPVHGWVGDLPLFDWPGPRTLVVATDGHAPAHGSLLLPDAGVLVAGDMLSDVEIPMLDLDGPAPLDRYRDALAALERVVERWTVHTVVPGHGSVARYGHEIAARLDADRAYVESVASGRPSDDPRLEAPWLAELDRQHRDAIHHR